MFALWAVVASLFVGCSDSDDPEPVPEPTLQEIVLDRETLTLNVGDEYTFKVQLLPEEIENVELTWSSSNTGVVTVDNGTVTAVANGEATVEARSGEVAATCKVTVSEQVVEVESITLDHETLNLTLGQTQQLVATVEPEDAVYELAWSSSDTKIATVDAEGLVTAVAMGEAVITVSAGEIEAECQVVVSGIPVETITLDHKNLDLTVGQTQQLVATVKPDDAVYELEWKSSDTQVATVDAEGLVTAVAAGEATITVSAGEVSVECPVVVTEPTAQSIELNEMSLDLEVDETFQLTATVQPENAVDKSVTWSSLNELVATVDQTGLVTAVAAGETMIMARAGEAEAACRVVVAAPVVLPSDDLNVGDYFYSDGSWSATLDESKTVVGVVFYVGDVTSSDATLAREYPQCNHGLVVSIAEVAGSPWQRNAAAYNATVASWIEANHPEFTTILAGDGSENDSKPLGYNNTKAIEAFNSAAENSAWPVEAVQALESFRTANPAPDATSGWYLPSAKELVLLSAGATEGSFVGVNSKANVEKINAVFDTIGATRIEGMFGGMIPASYASSSEANATQCFQMTTLSGGVSAADKTEAPKVRFILAF